MPTITTSRTIGQEKMADEKIAILGGAGMLGSEIAKICQKWGIEHKVFDLPEFDITNKAQLADAVKQSKIIINCAAFTDVEKAETDALNAYAINSDAVAELGKFARINSRRVIHISTDFVFDGEIDRPYVETDSTNPLNVYSKSKLMGEKNLIKSRCQCCIVRVQWTYGKGGNNFINKIITLAKEKKQLKVVDDQVGSPTCTAEAAGAILALAAKKAAGLYHFANGGFASRYDVAEFIRDKLALGIELQRCKSSEFETAAKRPLNSKFCCDKIKHLLDEPIRNWQEPLSEYLENI